MSWVTQEQRKPRSNDKKRQTEEDTYKTVHEKQFKYIGNGTEQEIKMMEKLKRFATINTKISNTPDTRHVS